MDHERLSYPPAGSARGRTARITAAIAFVASLAAFAALAAPTVPPEVMMPGTQPDDPIQGYTPPNNCGNCHGMTANPEFEPFQGWRGSMMAHSARDPLFWAALAIAEQDFLPDPDAEERGGVGDFCLRCHMPNGWLQGASVPTDGSAMQSIRDENGVECEHCHQMVNPDRPRNVAVTVEEHHDPFLANDPATGEAYHGSGQYVLNSQAMYRLGPYADAVQMHGVAQSPLHRQGELCGTCHDVSNPVVGDLAHNNGAQIPLAPGTYSGVLGGPFEDKAAFRNKPHTYGVVERTFSEWKASALDTYRVNAYPALPADLRVPDGALDRAYHRAYDANSNADYVDGTPRYYTCQTCHMAASTGVGCRIGGAPVRDDLPRHDLTGSGYWVPDLILYQEDREWLRFGGAPADPLQQAERDALMEGKARAVSTLRTAAGLDAVQAGDDLAVRVTNLTGHKLISGYPEGRRMWLNVRWLDAGDALVAEHGAYGPIGRTVDDLSAVTHQVESLLDPDDTVIYEAVVGMDQEWAAQLLAWGYDPATKLGYDRMTDAVEHTLGQLAAEPAGTKYHTFHFSLNNVILSDRRIPPYGFSRDEAAERNALPVPASLYGNPGPGGTYEHWDDVTLAIPVGAVRAEVRLFYQQTSWEYVQFLWLQNDGENAFLALEGVRLLDGWLNTGQGAPLEIALETVDLVPVLGPPGEASKPLLPAEQLRVTSYDAGTGDVSVTFTSACDASDSAIYWGPLAAVSSYGYDGVACGAGVTGVATFDPGPGSVFFLVVGQNGTAEGSYGKSSSGGERPESTSLPGCDLPQSLAATCD
jgi:hypothetical protein